MRKIIIILTASLLAACSANDKEGDSAQTDEAAAYVCDLEYSTYQATVTGYCQEPLAMLPKEFPVEDKEIEIKPLDQIPEVFWYNEKLKYSLVKQDGPAPMAFVIAGTGASYNAAKMIAMQKALYQKGYHAISISSPTYSNFIINATERGDLPGYLARDAETIYEVFQQIWQQVQEEDEVVATSFSLTGYSLGGAHSAFVSLVDEREKAFNFEKVLLVNPPVSLYNSVSVLDGYLDLKNDRENVVGMFENVFDRFAESYSEQESSAFDMDGIYQLFDDADLTEADLKLLIGTSFRMSSTDMLFAMDATYNIGALTYKNHEISKFESVTHSMHRGDDVTFTAYFEKGMVPRIQEKEPGVTREQLIKRFSLTEIEDYLRSSEKIHVVTNADDIILVDGEVEYLQKVFGQRAKIFPRGGHCGNMDRESFVAHFQSTFDGAK